MSLCFFSRKQKMVAFLFAFCACSACDRLSQPDSSYENGDNIKISRSNAFGYERFREFMDRNGGHHNLGPSVSEDAFKVRFYNYMMGKANDDPKQITEQARKISEEYKKKRMYDAASKYDSYQDVLIYGAETIPESWEDTTDLLEEMQLEIQKKRLMKSSNSSNCRKRCNSSSGNSNISNQYHETTISSSRFVNEKNQTITPKIVPNQIIQKENVPPIIVMPPPGIPSYHGEVSIGPDRNPTVNVSSTSQRQTWNKGGKTCSKCPINNDDPNSSYF